MGAKDVKAETTKNVDSLSNAIQSLQVLTQAEIEKLRTHKLGFVPNGFVNLKDTNAWIKETAGIDGGENKEIMQKIDQVLIVLNSKQYLPMDLNYDGSFPEGLLKSKTFTAEDFADFANLVREIIEAEEWNKIASYFSSCIFKVDSENPETLILGDGAEVNGCYFENVVLDGHLKEMNSVQNNIFENGGIKKMKFNGDAEMADNTLKNGEASSLYFNDDASMTYNEFIDVESDNIAFNGNSKMNGNVFSGEKISYLTTIGNAQIAGNSFENYKIDGFEVYGDVSVVGNVF